LPFRSAVDLAAGIRARRIGCRELLALYLQRIERYNPALNAVVVTDIAGARRRAFKALRTGKSRSRPARIDRISWSPRGFVYLKVRRPMLRPSRCAR